MTVIPGPAGKNKQSLHGRHRMPRQRREMESLGDVRLTQQGRGIDVCVTYFDAEVQSGPLPGMGNARQAHPFALTHAVTGVHQDLRQHRIGRPHVPFMLDRHRKRSRYRPREDHRPVGRSAHTRAHGDRVVHAPMTGTVRTEGRFERPRDGGAYGRNQEPSGKGTRGGWCGRQTDGDAGGKRSHAGECEGRRPGRRWREPQAFRTTVSSSAILLLRPPSSKRATPVAKSYP